MLGKTKWQGGEGNKTIDEFSLRFTNLGNALGLNDQHILITFKLGLPSNIYVNLVHKDGMQATLHMAKGNFIRCKCHINHSI